MSHAPAPIISRTMVDVIWEEIPGAVSYWATVTQNAPFTFTMAPHDDAANPARVNLWDISTAAARVLELYPLSAAARYIREGDIDHDAADAIAQVAAFGEIVYG